MRTTTSFSQWQRQCIRWMTRLGMLVLSILASGESIAYDNTRDPPFQAATEGRRFGSISVHPDGEQWLITETVMKNHDAQSEVIWLYHLPTKSMRQYQLPGAYQYVFPRFSPSGRYVLMSRYPVPIDAGQKAFRRALTQSEIVMMNTDGTGFQVLPIPKGRIFMPVMSPDESKVAFWLAKKERPPGERTILTNFTVFEFDVSTGSTRQFAGNFAFYEFHSLAYISNDQIVLGANGLVEGDSFPHQSSDLAESQIFFQKRGVKEILNRSYTEFQGARDPTLDSLGNTYFKAEIKHIGISIVMQTIRRKFVIWRVPGSAADILKIYADPTGNYLAVLYLLPTSYGSPVRRQRLGSIALFDVKKEIWVNVMPPLYQTADLIPVFEREISTTRKFN